MKFLIVKGIYKLKKKILYTRKSFYKKMHLLFIIKLLQHTKQKRKSVFFSIQKYKKSVFFH